VHHDRYQDHSCSVVLISQAAAIHQPEVSVAVAMKVVYECLVQQKQLACMLCSNYIVNYMHAASTSRCLQLLCKFVTMHRTAISC
jgi:hypothetical protein